ncbi:MAG: hypothetical protein COT24_04605 [Candidatus Kerfeldbacteria bacterium CG08_land_8_20_14_0_20_40_16]|uniref:Uncharacterized protein n=1 Tax=Candidatus Kerfeldbacteria bacterium CG08_land_8_20_14_0_20_40_16 TaxID=2014244 RepID=A0A2H0YV93_9BACT|nr:MAG: hypothetical protein COT24_04605 [Candidatus Kerfeldbacteria bacterium CG08_land_8_20_14_0_20_40_16]
MSKLIKIFPICLLVFLFPNPLLAVTLNVPIAGTKEVSDLSEYIRIFYNFFVTSSGLLATVMIIFGGYRWITAAGNSSKIGEAKETIISAVLGLILALTSYVILHTINPDITALKKLDIPIIQPMSGEGIAERLCDFDSETDNSDPDNPKPVECGKTIYVNPTENEEQCLGVFYSTPEQYCQVETVSGMKGGTIKNELGVSNHPTERELIAYVGPLYLPCGTVEFTREWHYHVGTACPSLTVSGNFYIQRCYLDGAVGNFVSDPGLSECSWITGSHNGMTAAELKTGCGRIANMYCKN